MALLLLAFSVFLACAPAAAEQAGGDAYAEGFRAFEQTDYAAALRLWTPLAERGDPLAQFGLGLIYERGIPGTPMDPEEALHWYRRAARHGVAPAQNNLAAMYAEGRVVSRDPGLAVTFWRQAAEAGYGPAQLNLAVALESGFGTARNMREAEAWYQRARDQGFAASRSPVEPELGLAGARVGERGLQSLAARVSAGAATGAAPVTPVSTPAPDARPPSGAYYVQLASLPSREGAVQLGKELSSRHADLLSDWSPTVRSVDLGSRGVWHRVQFGPIPSRVDAMAICARLRSLGRDCLVATPPSEDPGPPHS